jgi:hypothetical protein
MKISAGKFRWSFVILICIAAAALTVFLFSRGDMFQIREELKTIIPVFLEINFLLLLIGLLINLGIFRRLFGRLAKNQVILLLAVVLIAMLCSALIPPRTHRIYYDEDIYLHIAQNLNFEKKAQMCNYGTNEYGEFKCFRGEYNKEPYGYPYIVSLVFRLFGDKELAAHMLNNLLYGLSVLVLFFIVFLLFEQFLPALYSAVVFLLIPQNLVWSNTTAAEPAASFFTGLALLIFFLYLKEKRPALLFWAASVSAFSVQFRPESMLLLFLVFSALLLLSGISEFRKPTLYGMGAMLALLIIPHLFHIYSVQNEAWGAKGAKFALGYVAVNLKTNGLFYLNNREFPLLFALLALLGLVVAGDWRRKAIVGLWFLLFWGIFVAFYAGSYLYGADVRFSLVSYMPLAIFAGLGLGWIHRKLAGRPIGIQLIPLLIVLFVFTSFLPVIRAAREEAWAPRADHLYAQKFARMLPENSLILTHNPNMFFLWGKNAAQSSLVTTDPAFVEEIFNRFRGGVYFHYNFWCSVDDPVQTQFCQNVLNMFETRLVAEYSEKNYRFALYRLISKK